MRRRRTSYASAHGTATAGLDYAASSGTLTFQTGESIKHVYVHILNDGLVEGKEVMNLTLSNPAGATLGAAVTAVLEIFDDDHGVEFLSSSFLFLRKRSLGAGGSDRSVPRYFQ